MQAFFSHFLELAIDECALGTDRCSVHANCTNTNRSYTCQCKTGFTGNGFVCTGMGMVYQDLFSDLIPPPLLYTAYFDAFPCSLKWKSSPFEFSALTLCGRVCLHFFSENRYLI